MQPQVFEQMTTFTPPTDPFFQSPGAKQAETINAKGLATMQAGQRTVRDALTALKP